MAGMPRSVRMEFNGAIYHVMARGDRREPIVEDDEDRRTFVRTLGQACERSGMRVHAWVLMTNHYHLLVETPQPNLARAMGWFQNAYTRRINTRHRLWGHVFGDRYKAVVVERGAYFRRVLDYVHLNPVRAGLSTRESGIEAYGWSSLNCYLEPARREAWLETATGFSVAECEDSVTGRREFITRLEELVDWSEPAKAGAELRNGKDERLNVQGSLRRGWMFGSQELREELLRRFGDMVAARSTENGYGAAERVDHAEWLARRILEAGCQEMEVSLEELRAAAKGDWRKGLLAEMIQRKTMMRLDGISAALGMGDRSGCCRAIRQMRERMGWDAEVQALRTRVENAIFHD